MNDKRRARGFTIVELLIVIVVIGILAAITIVAYNGVQQRGTLATLQSDLVNAAKQMELARVNSPTETYPNTFPSGVKASAGVGLSLSENGTSYCINAQTTNSSTVARYYNSPSTGVVSGTCPGAVIPQSELGMSPNQINDTGFSILNTSGSGWGLMRGVAPSIAGVSRSGVSTDPFPNRKVLQIVNTANPSTTYAYFSGPFRTTGITSGKTYTLRYWVRLASGSYAAPPNFFGLQNGNATNTAITANSGTGSVTSAWREVSRSVTAIANSTSGNVIYIGMDSWNVQNNTFTLEYQGFEIYES